MSAAVGAVGAVYAVPKISSVSSRPAYGSVTGGVCPPDFCITWGSSGKRDITPITFPGTIAEFYNYDDYTAKSAAGDANSPNTPGMDLVSPGGYNLWGGLEECRNGNLPTGTLYGNILIFALVSATDGVYLVTIMSSPGDGESGNLTIDYAGLPAGTVWSSAAIDDAADADHAHTTSGTTAHIKGKWDSADSDGGVLGPGPNPFDCNSNICVTINTHSTDGIGPICFAYQTKAPDSDWLTGAGIDDTYDDGVNPRAPEITLIEVMGDFCLDGSWTPND